MNFKKQVTSTYTYIVLLSIVLGFVGCSKDDPQPSSGSTTKNTNSPTATSPDHNKDGKLNILLLGSSLSIDNNATPFLTKGIATELKNILTQDKSFNLEVNVIEEDIYKKKSVTYGLGQGGNVFQHDHFAHSLMQYYYWPEKKTDRWQKLAGSGAHKWDYVVITADPYMIAKLPSYYALGVNKIASKIATGGAKTLLLMQWPKNETKTASIQHFAEYTYRTGDNAKEDIKTIPAALAWEALPASKKDQSTTHPSANGAYLAAASIYAQIMNKSAANSEYTYDDAIADAALKTKTSEESNTHFTGEPTFVSPFNACNISSNEISYNHTGTSSENGILNGLNWVFGKSSKKLTNGSLTKINFNYGRANTNFEPHKRYKIDPSKFDFSFGFPMQDDGNHGNTSMLYGLDKRINTTNNGTDLGTALYMVRNSELPHARAIPIRTLYAQMKEAIPSQSAYSDSWHMHGNLDKATASFMYTLLTGECALGSEPSDKSSDAWKVWKSQKIGHETAHTLMTLKGEFTNCK